jgi:hypothetical protein
MAPFFLTKPTPFPILVPAEKPRSFSIRANGGASVALDQPGVGGITVSINDTKLLS